MPPKYQIHTGFVPRRFEAITRSGVIAWQEGCLRCTHCVKRQCVYGVYQKSEFDSRQMVDSLDNQCQDCYRCVQNCPQQLIQKSLNPNYNALGDEYWTPEIISNLWYQADTGRIPVSGAGYGGPFSGAGFDAMWTDMSEIVRPTRDGIHGREYISTLVDLGKKPMALEFGPRGDLRSVVPPMVEIPLPIIFDLLPWSPPRQQINQALLQGAKELGTFTILSQKDWGEALVPYVDHAALYLDQDVSHPELEPIKEWRLVEIPDGPDVMSRYEGLKERNPELLVAVRVGLDKESAGRVVDLTRGGAEILHLQANEFGLERDGSRLFIKDRVKEIHLHLVELGMRDQITLLAGGGVAMAEHMAKLIICGADAVTVDIPLLVAMECRVCRRCAGGISCPVDLDKVEPRWGGTRIRNLIAGWHNQLLEILGAMGLREVRRLRGEMGRAMFFEELEKELFATLGKRD